jgi:hypothetical protein
MDTFEKLRLIRGKNGILGIKKPQKKPDIKTDRKLEDEIINWYKQNGKR